MIKNNGVVIIEGHVQGLSNTRSFGEAGIPVIVIDKNNCIARYSNYCEAFYKCPDYLSDSFIDFLVELAGKLDLKDWLLVPSNDHAVINISKNKKRLEKFYKIITSDYSILNNIYNKGELLKCADRINVPIPRTFYPENISLFGFDLRFPVLVKGKQGLSFYKKFSKKVLFANNLKELKNQLTLVNEEYNINDVFVQELLPIEKNKTISFTAFVENGEIKTHWSGVKLREHPAKFGTATFCESCYCEKCYDYSKKLLKELNYTGVCEVEYLLDSRDGLYKLIEVNARTWLWVGLAKVCGVNYALYMYNYVNNIKNDYTQNYQNGVKWVNMFTDIAFTTIAILNGEIKFSEYISSFKGGVNDAIFSRKDFFPWIMYLLLIFKIKNR